MIQDSIWGVNAPKFIFDLGGEQEAEVLLDHWVPNEMEPDPKRLVLESELAAEREIIYRGDFLTFSGKIYLFKYPDPLSKWNEIHQYLHQKVVLHEHRDGEPFKDLEGNNALFYLDRLDRSYLTTLTYRDVIHLKFVSLKGIDYTSNTTVRPQLSNIIMSKNL